MEKLQNLNNNKRIIGIDLGSEEGWLIIGVEDGWIKVTKKVWQEYERIRKDAVCIRK